MANKESATTQDRPNGLRSLSLEQTFIIFAVIYFPCAFLFNNRGILGEVLLWIYTVAMVAIGLGLISKFILLLARSANEHLHNYGSLFVMYVVEVLIPLTLFKFIAWTVWDLLPKSAEGILCEFTCFVKDLYFLYNFQTALNWLITGTFVLFLVAAVLAVGRDSKKAS